LGAAEQADGAAWVWGVATLEAGALLVALTIVVVVVWYGCAALFGFDW
jgi:hypothetical protein